MTRPVHAGRRFYGVDVGIVLLDNDLPRPLGDVGNARTFDFPVAYATGHGADTVRVVENGATGLYESIAAAADALVASGVRAVTTCCGFLAVFQRELAGRTGVPTATSSLLQVPQVLRLLAPDRTVCVLSVNASTLSDAHLAAVGIDETDRARVRLVGLEDTEHFYRVIITGEHRELDLERAGAEVVAAARAAVADAPDIGAFVFECTNLPPYAAAVREATGLPVWDAVTLIDWLRAGVAEEVS